MREPDFRAEMQALVKAAHISRVNDLVDDLREERPDISMPYVAPHYDESNARILTLMSNPGPKAGGDSGSTFLSFENDDGTAERIGAIYERVGLTGAYVLPWNAFPWYVHGDYPNGLPLEYVKDGQDALHRVLEAAPNIVVIVAHGGDAHRAVRLFARDPRFQTFIEQRAMRFWETRHTGNRAFSAAANERERRLETVAGAYWDAMAWAGIESSWLTGVRARSARPH